MSNPTTPHNASTDLPYLVERMHRRFLDVVRIELARVEINDISPVQALMLANIGNAEISVRDLIERGYYLGSNASYNLKHLVEGGYITRTASERDRRSARLKLAAKGKAILDALTELNGHTSEALLKADVTNADLETTYRTLRRLERRWSDSIRFSTDLDQDEI